MIIEYNYNYCSAISISTIIIMFIVLIDTINIACNI